jgi:hypothetical protein
MNLPKLTNINKYIDLGVLGMAAISASLGATDMALLGIIIFLTCAVITRDK